jgi:hypothetical protein
MTTTTTTTTSFRLILGPTQPPTQRVRGLLPRQRNNFIFTLFTVLKSVWFEIPTAVVVKTFILWDETPCSPVKVKRGIE